jgi:glycosyltransferase involved in cell wall biosynthesis
MPFLIKSQKYLTKVDRIVEIPATAKMSKHLLISGWALDRVAQDPGIVRLRNAAEPVKRIYDVRMCERWGMPKDSRIGFEIMVPVGTKAVELEFSFGSHSLTKEISLARVTKQLRRESKMTKINRYLKNLFAAVVSGELSQIRQVWNRRHRKYRQAYEAWLETNEHPNRAAAIQEMTTFSRKPLISLVVPVYNVEEEWLSRFISSVQSQWYEKWELCLADDHSSDPRVVPLLKKFSQSDDRIKVTFRAENGHISEATNSAIKLASGQLIGFMDDDDELSADALYEIAKALNEAPETDFFYTDEDQIDEDGRRSEPAFKPDYSPNTLLTRNYINHFTVVSKNLLERSGPLRSEFDGSQDFDFVLRATEKAQAICHIPKILYHWRALSTSVAGDPWSKRYAYDAGKRAVEAALQRRGIPAAVTMLQDLGRYRIDYFFKPGSVLVLADEVTVEQFKQVKGRTQYSHAGFMMCPLSKALKRAQSSQADYVALLTGAIPSESRWLGNLLNYMRGENVAVAGGLIKDARGRIDDAGVSLAALKSGEPFEERGSLDIGTGYQFRTFLPRDIFAVTEQCLLISRELFVMLGGLDTNLPKGLRGIDLCVRAYQQGHGTTLWEPYSILRSVGPQLAISHEAIEKYVEGQQQLKDPFGPSFFPTWY